MKRLNSSEYLFLMLLFSACNSQKEDSKNSTANAEHESNKVWDVTQNTYAANKTSISLESKSVDDLLKDQYFESDSARNSYKKALLMKNYFVLKINPDNNLPASIKTIDKERIKKYSFLVTCKDTLYPIEVVMLHDFGLSKAKQYMLVFSKKTIDKACDSEIIVGGIFNRYDQYNFQLKEF